MLSVDDAIAAILEGAAPVGREDVSLQRCTGRIAAQDVHAALTQPPFAASAMDGYAVRSVDMAPGATLTVIGEAPAGLPFEGDVGVGQAVRIFTGAPVPVGADHVVIQEDVRRDGAMITITEPQSPPRHIRAAGIDFKNGDKLVSADDVLHEIHGSILATANLVGVQVYRRPRVALFSNGDELKEPGADLKPGEIINSNHYALGAMIEKWGGDVDYLGCAADTEAAIIGMFESARRADIIVPVGGASVGDYDYVKSAFAKAGGEMVFDKIAVRPGKPTWCGALGEGRLVGLPGNPASAIVTAALFVQPLVRRLAGRQWSAPFATARLVQSLNANGRRESYLRAVAAQTADGYEVRPAVNQDSSLLFPFVEANALIRRPVDAPACDVGDDVEIVWLR